MCELRSEDLYKGRSSQLYTQLLQLRKESLKKYRCSALPIKLTKLNSTSLHCVSAYHSVFPRSWEPSRTLEHD